MWPLRKTGTPRLPHPRCPFWKRCFWPAPPAETPPHSILWQIICSALFLLTVVVKRCALFFCRTCFLLNPPLPPAFISGRCGGGGWGRAMLRLKKSWRLNSSWMFMFPNIFFSFHLHVYLSSSVRLLSAQTGSAAVHPAWTAQAAAGEAWRGTGEPIPPFLIHLPPSLVMAVTFWVIAQLLVKSLWSSFKPNNMTKVHLLCTVFISFSVNISRIQPTSILRGSRGRGPPLRPFGQTVLSGCCPNSPRLDRCMPLPVLLLCADPSLPSVLVLTAVCVCSV